MKQIDFFIAGFWTMAWCLMLADSACAQNILLADERGSRIIRYELQSGQVIDHLVASSIDPLNAVVDLVVDPSGTNLFAISAGSGIWRYEAQTGRRRGRIVDPRFSILDEARGATFGPDGKLYITDRHTDQVLRVSQTGESLEVFVTARAGGLISPWRGILFDLDGNLLVTSLGTHSVIRFNGTTGVFMDVVVSPDSGLADPTGMAMDADGRLYVCGYRGVGIVIREPDGTTRPLWPDGVPLVQGCEDVAIMPNGNLLVVSSLGSSGGQNVVVVRPDGSIQREVIRSEDLPLDSWKFVAIALQPAEPETCEADFNGDGVLDIFDFLAFQNAFAAGCP